MRKKTLISMLLLLPMSVILQAEVVVKEDYSYYTVYPSSLDTVIESLNSTSPIRQDGKLFHGRADYDIKWDVSWSYNAKACWLTTVKVNLVNTYTMPKLVTSNEEIKHRWSQWYPRLMAHEKNHGAMAKQTAYDLHNGLVGLPAKPTCELLYAAAEKLAKPFLAELDAKNIEYDERTNHGDTEGATAADYF